MKSNRKVNIEYVRNEINKDKILYYFVSFTCIVTFLIYFIYQDKIVYNYQFIDYIHMVINCFKAIFIAWSVFFYFSMALKKKDKLFITYFKSMLKIVSDRSKVAVFIIRLMLLNVSIANYTYLKQIIPDINPFKYDIVFYNWDKFIHGGLVPWEVLHGIFSSSYWNFFFNLSYNIWFILVWGSLLYFMWYCKAAYIRQVYLLSFFMTWFFIGGILAIIMSAAGPCFLHLLYIDDLRYLPLIDRLHEQVGSLWLLRIYGGETSQLQSYLWDAYSNRDSSLGAGISAMPSMHVSSSTLLALGAYQISKKAGVVLWSFALVIMISSVYLGWHYAVDGYLAFFITILVWKFSQYIVSKSIKIKQRVNVIYEKT
ncbi:phosphatase PAP2 family protein [Vibrio natriegens]|uniref:phosphatase PAP2 family protein n=1 Tax=Vibrio natriegens TaxID=691 RepID=UPI001FBBB326|nr:phosphatase PAP2 family protein [Vibrio natriegens]